MTRLAATLRHEVRLEYRYGIFAATAVTTVLAVLMLRTVFSAALDLMLPFTIFVDLTVTGFYFLAGMVLFEKAEGTLLALVVTPLRFWEYLAGKVLTLTALAVVITLIVTALTWGTAVNLPLLIVATALASAFWLVVGFVVVAPYDGVSAFLVPASLITLIACVPLLAYFGIVDSPLFYLWPTWGGLLLTRGGFQVLSAWRLVYGVVYLSAWIVGLAWLGKRRFDRYVVGRHGGR